MNQDQLKHAIRDALAVTDLENADFLHIEKMGDSAFDALRSMLDGDELPDGERAVGVRLLSHLTRQFCFNRKAELLDVVKKLVTDRSRGVRSAAVHVAITSNLIAKGVRNPEKVFGRTLEELRAETLAAAARGVAMGLEEDIDRQARTFLEHGGTMPEAWVDES